MAVYIPAGRYITVQEFADRSGLTKQAVYNAIWEGRLKSYKIEGRHLIRTDAVIVNTRIAHGNYIGIQALKEGDLDKFLEKRNLKLQE